MKKIWKHQSTPAVGVKKGCLTSCLQLCTPAVQATHGTWGPGRGQPISWSQESVGLVHSGNSLARWSPHAGFPKQVWTCPLIPPSGLYKLGPPLASCGSEEAGESHHQGVRWTVQHHYQRHLLSSLPCVDKIVSVLLSYVCLVASLFRVSVDHICTFICVGSIHCQISFMLL